MSSQKQKRELQPEQAAAAYEIKKHISVTAGPGSGKTTVLVERYLHILRQNTNLNIDQIVAITFTNRAANEMRERLRDELNLMLQTAADGRAQALAELQTHARRRGDHHHSRLLRAAAARVSGRSARRSAVSAAR